MNKTILRLLLLAVVCCMYLPSIVYAQSPTYPNITGSFNNISIGKILDQLESNTSFSFYYKKEDLPTRRFSYTFKDEPLDQVLQQIFTPTTLGFITYRDNSIVILPAEIAISDFTINYYKARAEAIVETEEKQLIEVGNIRELSPSGNALVKGRVRDAETNDPVVGASVQIQNLDKGTITDADGNFEIEVPAGLHYLKISYIGFEELNRSLRVMSDGDVRIKLEKGAIDLEAIEVKAQKADDGVESAEIGVATIDVQSIKKTPSFLGEADVVKTLLLTAGVSTVGEGASGFNVRGGDVDQNLILQDEGIILNSSHALGFFSSFNTDLVSSVKLYKANMPAQFGGRVSSVLDLKLKDGDFEDFKMKGGVGPVTSRLSLEGPIIKEKVSYIGGFRASYADWVLNQINNIEVQRSSVYFYDANLKVTAKLNDKNTLTFSGYAAEDEFVYNEEFGFNYKTYMGQMILRNIFNENLYSNLSASVSRYESSRTDFSDLTASQLFNNVDYLKIKEQLTYSPSTLLKIDAGLAGVFYRVEPGTLEPFGEESTIISNAVEEERGLETAAFINAEYALNERILISAGLRLSLFNFLGPNTVFQYSDPDNPTEETIIGTEEFGSGEVIASYFNPEPRFSLRYRLDNESSVKGGYSRTVQYINQIFNSDAPTPVAQWQLSTDYIEPVKSHNLSVGYFRNFLDNNWETSAEVYTRFIDQLYDYRDFADLTANEHLETELLDGEGRSYGLEVSVRKKEGVFNGSFSYTWSRSERLIEGINKGEYYPSNFDKPHDLSLVLNYQPNRRNTITVNFIYGSGRPTTPPVGNYLAPNGLVIPVYSERNAGRIPDYHRMDIAYTLGQSYKRDQKFRTSWTLSLYNVYGRKNAFSVFFTQAAFQGAQANQLSILGSIFPSLTFNFEAF